MDFVTRSLTPRIVTIDDPRWLRWLHDIRERDETESYLRDDEDDDDDDEDGDDDEDDNETKTRVER